MSYRLPVLLQILFLLLSASALFSCNRSNDSDTAQLRKEIEELKKARDVNQNGNSGEDLAAAEYDVKKWVSVSAGSHLTLRATPDAETGEKLSEIPNAAVVFLGECKSERLTISGRTGRWCRAKYDENEGWLFDGFLVDSADAGQKSQTSETETQTNQDTQGISSLTHADLLRVLNENPIKGICNEGRRQKVEILRVGQFNSEKNYWPVQVKKWINDRKYEVRDVLIYKDDYGDVVAMQKGC